MTNHQDNETFCYTYSAKQQEEISKIRRKYETAEEDKMEQLRRMDAGVTRKASVRALSIGIIGALVMGSGMSLIMTNLREIFGMHQTAAMMTGIVIGSIGIVLVCCAYPVYNRAIAKERKRIAPEILRLTDELMK